MSHDVLFIRKQSTMNKKKIPLIQRKSKIIIFELPRYQIRKWKKPPQTNDLR